MNRLGALAQALGLSLAVVVSGCTASVNPEQGQAVVEIKNLGGRITVDEKSAHKTVIAVNLQNTKLTDAVWERLSEFTKLERLNLTNTKVTDGGVEKLKQALPHGSILVR
jgi:hypothetical protein